ncbi:MAG: hypothetical protein AB7T49_15995 [Oligoflexales bacterium]
MDLPHGYQKELQRAGIEFWCHADEDANREWIMTSLSAGRTKVISFFDDQVGLDPIRVIIAKTRIDYEYVVTRELGVDIEIPSRPSRIAQPQRNTLVLLSPTAFGNESCYEFSKDDFSRLLIHELTHMAVEEISPKMDDIPSWIHEGLAVYVSKQGWEEMEFYAPFCEAVRNENFPTLDEVMGHRKNFYIFGWALIQLLVNSFGKNWLLQLLRSPFTDESFFCRTGGKQNLESLWVQSLLNCQKNLTELR